MLVGRRDEVEKRIILYIPIQFSARAYELDEGVPLGFKINPGNQCWIWSLRKCYPRDIYRLKLIIRNKEGAAGSLTRPLVFRYLLTQTHISKRRNLM